MSTSEEATPVAPTGGSIVTGTETPVRTETFPHTGTADIQVHVDNGEVLVELADVDNIVVAVYRSDEEASGSGLFGRLGLGRSTSEADVNDAVRQVSTHFTRGHLVVQAPKRRLSPVPLRILVRARFGSKVFVTGNNARLSISGQAKSLKALWGKGDLNIESVAGTCQVRAGSGRVRIGESSGHLNLRIGTADVDLGRVAGDGAKLTTGSGVVQLGTVEGDVSLTTGAGTIGIADAAAGKIEIKTGPGNIRIGVRSGVSARLDLNSRTGKAKSELPVSAQAPASGSARLQISATSSHGDITVYPAG